MSKKDKPKTKKDEGDIMAMQDIIFSTFSQMLFILLPMLIYSMVFIYKGKSFEEVILLPEWAFASVIMVGQIIIKIIETVVKATVILGNLRERYVSFIATIIIVFLFIPSSVLLVLVIYEEPVKLGLGYAQFIMFIISLITYFVVSVVMDVGQDKQLMGD